MPGLSRFFLFIFLFFSAKLYCQNISGEWVGEIFLKSKGQYLIYFPIYFEIKHDTITNKIIGASSTKSFDTLLADCEIQGEYKPNRKLYIIDETKTIYNNLKSKSPKDSIVASVLNRFRLKVDTKDKDVLSGTCDCINFTSNLLCKQDLKIRLSKYKPEK